MPIADGSLSTKQTGRSSHAVSAFKPFGRDQLKWEAAFIFITIEGSSKEDAPDLGSANFVGLYIKGSGEAMSQSISKVFVLLLSHTEGAMDMYKVCKKLGIELLYE